MLCRKISKTCLALSLVSVGVSGFSIPASSTTVIEFFGRNSCSSDAIVQDALKKILQNEDNVIIINCRTWFDSDSSSKTFSHKFFNERHDIYTNKFRMTNMFHSSPLIVNGRWDAFYQDMMPAVSISKTDKIEPIAMEINDNMLDVSIPDVKSEVGSGDIMLFAYMPSQGGKTSLYVDADVSLTDDMKERLSKNQSVPFVKKMGSDPFFIRPVLSMVNIGHWNGTKISMSVSLDELTTMASSSVQDLSYVTVLFEGGKVGPILAVGEIVSSKEYQNTVPSSVPQDIKYMSHKKL